VPSVRQALVLAWANAAPRKLAREHLQD
jgi:hypothetical protein